MTQLSLLAPVLGGWHHGDPDTSRLAALDNYNSDLARAREALKAPQESGL